MMKSMKLVTVALAAVFATTVLAQSAPTADPSRMDMRAPQGDRGMPPPHDFRGPHDPGEFSNPAMAVFNDLEQLHRLYLMAGRESEMQRIYDDVLKNTRDPMVRHFVTDAIVRLQLRPVNTSQAITTLQGQLKEDLSVVNTRAPGQMPPPAPKAEHD
jgi:hypothetical protein